MKKIFETEIPVIDVEMIMEVIIEKNEKNDLFNWKLTEHDPYNIERTTDVRHEGSFSMELNVCINEILKRIGHHWIIENKEKAKFFDSVIQFYRNLKNESKHEYVKHSCQNCRYIEAMTKIINQNGDEELIPNEIGNDVFVCTCFSSKGDVIEFENTLNENECDSFQLSEDYY